MSLLDKATIITTPTAHSNGKLHSIKGGAVADFDVVRGSAATRVNAEGLIESVATNIPRIDYTTGEGVILTEPQSTNLIPYSEDFSQWGIQTRVSYSTGDVSPSGDTDATKIIASTDNNTHRVKDNLSTVTGDYTFSVFAKKGEYKNILLWDDTINNGVGFNLDNGTVFRNPSINHEIEDFGNGWLRLSVTQSFSSQQLKPSIYLYDNSSTPQIVFSGNDSDGLYIWGAQVEALPYSTSYIPTSGAIATRLADSVTGAGDAATFNDSEGVLYLEASAIANDGTSRRISLTDGSISNRVSLEFDEVSDRIVLFVSSNGISQVLIHNTPNLLQFNKIAVKYKQNDFAIWFNGAEVATGVSGNTPVGLNDLSFDSNGGQSFYGKTKTIAVFSEALTDEELTCLTTI